MPSMSFREDNELDGKATLKWADGWKSPFGRSKVASRSKMSPLVWSLSDHMWMATVQISASELVV